MKRHLRRPLKLALLTVSALTGLLLTLVLALTLLLHSESGSRWLLQTLQDAVPELQIVNPHGNLIDGFRVDGLRLDTPEVSIVIEGIDARLGWPDLLRGFATVKPLRLQRLTIEPLGPDSDEPIVLPTLVAPLALNLPSVQIDELRVRSGDTDVVLSNIRAAVRWVGTDIRLRGATLNYEGMAIAADGSLRFRGDYPLRVDGTVRADYLPEATSAKVRGSLRNLLVDAHSGGKWPLKAKARLRLLDEHLPLELEARLSQPVIIDAGIDTLTVNSVELKAKGDLRRIEGTLNGRLQDARYGASRLDNALVWDGATLTVGSQLQLTSGGARSECALHTESPARWACDGDISQLDLAPWLNGLPGQISTPFTVAGRFDAPIQLELNLPELSGELDGVALSGALQLTSPDLQRWQIGEATVAAGPNRLTASGVIDKQSNLQAELNAPALARLYAGLTGSARARLALTGPLQEPDLHGTLAVQNLHTTQLQLASGNAQIDIRRLGLDASHIDVSMRGLTASGIRADTRLSLTGTRARHNWQLQVAQPQNSSELRCAGALATTPQRYQLDCPVLQGSFATSAKKTVAWRNDAPLRATWNGERNELGLSGFCLRAEPASLCVTPGLAYQRGSWQPFRAALNELPLRWWRRSLPEGLRLSNAPRLSAHIDFISPKPLRAAAEVRLGASEWRWRTPDSPQTLKLDAVIATATLNPNQAQLAANLNAPTLGKVAAELAVADPLGAKQLRGLFTLSDLQLAALGWAVPDVDTLKGQIDGTLAISGTAQQPVLQGQFELKEGAISALGSTDTVTDINALLTLANQRGALTSQFRLGQGTGKLEGDMTWTEAIQDRKVELVLQGSNLRVEPLPNSEVLFSPDLKLLVTANTSRVDGAVQIDKADIRMAQLPPETVSPSRDAVVSGRETKRTDTPFAMDVALKLGKNTHFSGFGADVDLTGKLRMQAENAREMETTGQIKVAKGRYRAYGQRLIVRKGQFTFTGDLDNPELNLEAIREFPPGNRDIVGLRISGPLRDPVAQLFSDQALSESEIAYYLLTGRKNDSSAPNQQFSAGGSLLSLGLAGGEEQAAKLAQKFGISGFSIGTTAAKSGGTEAEVSGYVFRDLYVRYGRSLGEQVDSVTLQYPLTEQLMIQTISSIEQTVELIYTFTVE